MRCSLAEFGHFHVSDTEPFRLVSGPFDCDLVVEIGPGWMMILGFTFVCDQGHELPSLGEGWEGEVTRDALLRPGELPCGKEGGQPIGQVGGLVGSKYYVILGSTVHGLLCVRTEGSGCG